MLKTYIKIAVRNLGRNKLYTIVNVLGLTIGLTSCLLIGVYILQEFSYDKFHTNGDRIARVTMEYKVNDVVSGVALTGTKVGPQLARTFPEIAAYVRTYKYPRVVGNEANLFEVKRFLYADSAFFSVFSFKLLAGNKSTALDGPNKVVLTKSAAKKYFNTENALGKTLRVGEDKIFTVSGIAEDCPENSQIRFDMVASFSSLSAYKSEEWWSANYTTYILTKDDRNLPLLQQEVARYMQTVSKELNIGDGNYLKLNLQPMKQVHLYSALEGLEPNGNIVYIYILGAVGLLILVIACVNYANLANAQSARRASEIGVRKVLGANKGELFRQFIGESFVLALIAFSFALFSAYLLLPQFNQLSGKTLDPMALLQTPVLILAVSLVVIVSILSGFYPALLLANLQLSKVLKAGFSFTAGGSKLRKSLIVLQFAISIFLVISTLVIIQQLSYINNKELGYNKEHIIILPVDNKMLPGIDGLKNILKNTEGVQDVAGAYEEPTNIGWMDGITKGTGASGELISIAAMPVDEDFISTMGIEVIAGNNFTEADVKSFDTSDNGNNIRYSFMLNESAAKKLGWTPEEAVGQTLSKGNPGEVRGVVKDFHFKSMHTSIGPLLIFLEKNLVQRLFVKIKPDDLPRTLSKLENVWAQKVPHRPFEYHFLDDDFDALYKTEQKAAGLFSAFSTLAILLACLGLFALTSFAVVQRTREIGIRKILGATIPNLFLLLSKDFLLLIVIALGIACPLAWLAGSKWLEQFSYRIVIEWWMFAAAGVSTMLIAVLTLSYQAIKAARANPVDSLRNE